MASAFGHALVAVTLGKSYSSPFTSPKFWILGIICSILPDADVISFQLGIPYEHFYGHRGFTHSLLFAFLLGVLVTQLFYKKVNLMGLQWWKYVIYFFLCTASHALLDGMTTGGLGVALFSPFDNTRYFLPWRPIQVSPIGAASFFSEWGIRVIKSELLWIGIPCLCYIVITAFFKRKRSPQSL